MAQTTWVSRAGPQRASGETEATQKGCSHPRLKLWAARPTRDYCHHRVTSFPTSASSPERRHGQRPPAQRAPPRRAVAKPPPHSSHPRRARGSRLQIVAAPNYPLAPRTPASSTSGQDGADLGEGSLKCATRACSRREWAALGVLGAWTGAWMGQWGLGGGGGTRLEEERLAHPRHRREIGPGSAQETEAGPCRAPEEAPEPLPHYHPPGPMQPRPPLAPTVCLPLKPESDATFLCPEHSRAPPTLG